MKRLLLCLFTTLLLAGCSDAVTYMIDNPNSPTLELEIDDTTYLIPSGVSLEISLEPGLHRMRSKQLGELQFIVYKGGAGGLINPTLSDYVIARETYVTDESKLKNFGSIESTILLDGVPFTGSLELRNQLFIDKTWRFPVQEPFPQQVTGHVSEHGGNIFSKIFRRDEFVEYYEENHGIPGYFAAQRDEEAARAPRQLVRAPSELPRLEEPYEPHTGPLREIYAQRLKATEVSEQERLQKAYFDAQMAYTRTTATFGSKASREANLAANHFVSTLAAAMGSSALVLP